MGAPQGDFWPSETSTHTRNFQLKSVYTFTVDHRMHQHRSASLSPRKSTFQYLPPALLQCQNRSEWRNPPSSSPNSLTIVTSGQPETLQGNLGRLFENAPVGRQSHLKIHFSYRKTWKIVRLRSVKETAEIGIITPDLFHYRQVWPTSIRQHLMVPITRRDGFFLLRFVSGGANQSRWSMC